MGFGLKGENMKINGVKYKTIRLGILFISLLFFLQLATSAPVAPRNRCLIVGEVIEANYSPEKFIEADGRACNQEGRLNPSEFFVKLRIINSEDFSSDDKKDNFYLPCNEQYAPNSEYLIEIFPSNEEEFSILSNNLFKGQIISGEVRFAGDECFSGHYLTNYAFSQENCPNIALPLPEDNCNYFPIYNGQGCIISYKKICNAPDCPILVAPESTPDGCEYVVVYDNNGCMYYELRCESPSQCQTNLDCSDQDACTSDICDLQLGKCTHHTILNGCSNADSCIPIGVRVGNAYCDIDRTLKEQKSDGSLCSNMFECRSNVCVNGKCIQTSLIEKILHWLQGLFK